MSAFIDKYNSSVEDWGKGAARDMQARASGYGIRHRPNSPSPGPSVAKVLARFRYNGGLINIVSIKLPRHLIYVHKGAGKGRGGHQGSRWVDKYGNRKTTNPQSLGKAGTDGRQEKPFINDVLEGGTGVEHLADIVVQHTGDIITGNILIK